MTTQYSFTTTQPAKFSAATSALETAYAALLHTANPLPSPAPSPPTPLNGYLGLSQGPGFATIYVTFFQAGDTFEVKDASGNVVYTATALASIPTQAQVAATLGPYL